MRKEFVWEDEAAINEFLDSQEIGHLTTIDDDGWPQTVAINYLWQGGAIYFHTVLGEKINHLRANPKVSFAVTEPLGLLTSEISSGACHDTQLGLSVLINGLAKEINDPATKYRALNKIISKYDPDAAAAPESEKLAPESLIENPGFSSCLIVCIEVVKLSARRNLLLGKPDIYRKSVAAYFQQLAQNFGRERDLRTAVLLNQTLE